MKHISTEQLKKYLSYNKATGKFTWNERKLSDFKSVGAFKMFNSRFKGEEAGTVKICGGGKKYIVIVINYIKFRSQHLAWQYMNGCQPTHQIDHIDGNSLNNKISNLRDVSQQDNNKNKTLDKRSRTGITGVYTIKKSRLWKARICCDGKTSYLGTFASFFDACCARKSAEVRLGFHANHGKKNQSNRAP